MACSDDSQERIVYLNAEETVVLLPFMATDIELAKNSTTNLSVSLIYANGDNAGHGLVDQEIQWGIESGDKSVQLSSDKSMTVEDGLATISITGTDVLGKAVVVASSEIAPTPVRFSVAVQDVPTGSLELTTAYHGHAEPVNYVIKLYDGADVSCARNDLVNGVVMNWHTEAEAEPILEPVNSKDAKFSNLSTEMRYAAVAYGFAANGAPVAVGCLDSGIDILANQTTAGTIQLNTIDLNPGKTYHVRSYFDFGDLGAELGGIGKFINMLDNFNQDPAGMFLDRIFGYFTQNAGLTAMAVKWLTDTFKLSSELTKVLNELIGNEKTTSKIALFICQFHDIVRLMEFMGTIDVEKSGQIELQGKEVYDGFAFHWRIGCAGGADLNCGRIPVTSKMLGLDESADFMEGTWEGSLANGYDKFSIDNHALKLKYGELLAYLFNNELIPRVTGNQATGIESLFAYWFKLDSIAQWISDHLKWGGSGALGDGKFSFTFDEAQNIVNSIISAMLEEFGFGAAYLELEKATSEITLNGSGYFEDTNGDNVVDIIRDGRWSGSMVMTTESKSDNGTGSSKQVTISTTTAVTGFWSGYNLKNVVHDGNMYCTFEKSETDSFDQVCAYPQIDMKDLATSNTCKKWYDEAGL